MGSYKIFFRRSAEKELRKVASPLTSKIVDKIRLLSVQSRPSGIQMLKGEDRYYRLRQGDYRVIYEVDDAKQEIYVVKIGHRREVYD